MTTRPWRLLALLLALTLIAGACGSDDDGDSESTGDGDSGSEAGGDPIKIGALTSLTGPFTSWGIHVEAGMQMAVDDINADGGVDGRTLELIVADDQSDAEEAVNQMERLIEDGVIAVAGTISSGVGAATAALAEEEQIPLFLSKAGSQAILTADSRYTFRTCLPAGPMVAEQWVQYAASENFDRVGSVIADYAWGQSFLAASEAAFESVEGSELKSEIAPVPEQDFTTYLRALDDFDPDLLLATGHPPGSGAILAQAADLGIDVNVAGPGSSLTAVLEAAGDTAVGRYADHSCADYFSDSYAELATRYVADYDRPFMEDDAVAGYAVVTMLADAVANVGDDRSAIAEYLHGQTYDDLPGMAYSISWTEWGELANATMLLVEVGEGPPPEGLSTEEDWWPVELFRTAPLDPYVPGS